MDGYVLIFTMCVMIWKGHCANVSMAGECRPSQIYKEMTLKGGINAGTYKDVGGVTNMEQCQNKCCSFPACDLAFMLAGNCYLVGCKDQKQCAMQPAKESSFKPMISYVTRWNNEGVKHTVLPVKENQYTCPTMKPINKVTLKGGLQAGDFTDIGRVTSIGDCYNVCCQQEKCDLAFMLGQNCFTVSCKDKRLCVTTPAQPSIFNPQIAYVTKRGLTNVKKENIPRPDGGTNAACPNTRVFENMTLKGGVDAGAYKDHGKVKDMTLCRRICCEMTECHLAFLLGTNCFSVKCADVDSCRAQRAKPSAYSPKISYVRKVGTNQLLPNQIPNHQNATSPLRATPQSLPPPQKQSQTPLPTPSTTPPVQGALAKLNQLSNGLSLQTTTSTINSAAGANPTPNTGLSGIAALLKGDRSGTTSSSTTPAASTTASPSQELLNALQQESLTTQQPSPQDPIKSENGTTRTIPNCKLGKMKTNMTLKGGRNSGEFIEQKGTKNMKECAQKCCMDPEKKCNLAFMLGNACYSVRCSKPELCRTIKAPPTKFNPLIQYVRGLDDTPSAANTNDPATSTTTTTTATTTAAPTETTTTITTTIPPTPTSTCRSQPIVHGKSIRGGKKAGKFKIFRAIKDIDTCIDKCCSMKNDCDVAYMEDNDCYSIQCFKKSACTAIPLRDTDVNPTFAYMDHFLDKIDEEEAESEITTELEQQSDISACGNVEIKHNKTLKGGTRAGRFHPLGKKTMDSCINSCCDRPNCDIAYLLNGHCYSVQCTDSKLCQDAGEPAKAGDTVQMAYMNKGSSGDKQRDYMAVYVIVASLVIACVAGALIWVVYAFKKRQRKTDPHKRLLEPDDEEEETIDNIMHKKPSSRTRYKQRRY